MSHVIIELLKAKCLPALCYGLEACPVNKSLNAERSGVHMSGAVHPSLQ